ncbi:MAG: hypothetical protein SWK90_07880 [Chloroflexota bacterium]|nr:hypothetical protein [Chloroflexota bacterium]
MPARGSPPGVVLLLLQVRLTRVLDATCPALPTLPDPCSHVPPTPTPKINQFRVQLVAADDDAVTSECARFLGDRLGRENVPQREEATKDHLWQREGQGIRSVVEEALGRWATVTPIWDYLELSHPQSL